MKSEPENTHEKWRELNQDHPGTEEERQRWIIERLQTAKAHARQLDAMNKRMPRG